MDNGMLTLKLLDFRLCSWKKGNTFVALGWESHYVLGAQRAEVGAWQIMQREVRRLEAWLAKFQSDASEPLKDLLVSVD